jgi:uncharacterized protein YcsI (UPF0317 family)
MGVAKFEYVSQEVSDRAAMREHVRGYAKSIWPHGTVLVCRRCQRTEPLSVGEAAAVLAGKWPVCHGESMRIGDGPEGLGIRD